MIKNFLRMTITFVALYAAYFGYSRGFAILSGYVATPRSVPRLPAIATDSNSKIQTTDLAIAAFGPDHWAVRAPLRYYMLDRGYCIYWRDQVRNVDGTSWELSPFAVVILDKTGRGHRTITSDGSKIDFNRSFDAGKPGDAPVYVTHAVLHGNVIIRDDKGTPSIADDLRSEPINSLEFSDKDGQIRSGTEEKVVLYQGGTTVRGIGLVMDLLRRLKVQTEEAVAGMPNAGFEGVRSITLLRDVKIDVQDVGRSGIVPGGAKVAAEATKDGKKKPVKVEPKPGSIQCTDYMRIDLAQSHMQPRVGPPAPPEPTFATFNRNVRIRQGLEGAIDQLDADHFTATLYPAERDDESKRQVGSGESKGKASAALAAKSGGATTKDQPKAEPEEEEGGAMTNLVLHRAHATGHAVWLQSTSQHLRALGNELTYQKFKPGEPDQIYLRGDRQTEVVKTEFYSTGKDAGKPRYVDTIRTKDVTIYRYPPGGPAPSFVARGPGTMETRPAGRDDLERFASWRDELQVVPILGTEDRRVTLLGYPRVRSTTQGNISADKKIVARLTPKTTAAGAESLALATADGMPVKPIAATSDPSGDAMRLRDVQAYENVKLVTLETAADPKANPPRAASPYREIIARKEFEATFVDAPAQPKPLVLPKEKVIAEAPRELEGVVDAATPAVQPAPKPPEPPIHAEADKVTAIVRQQEGSNRGQIEEAKLIGAAEIHQDPAEGKSQGTDISGNVIYVWNKGENRARFQAHGAKGQDAKAITEARKIYGPILQVDQAEDHAWVIGMGRLELEQTETDFLDDTARISTEAKQEDKGEPKVKKGPLVITWGRGADDKDAMMHFYGRPVLKNGQPGPAQATFYSHVLAKTDDSSASCEYKLTATFDAQVPFVRPKRDPKSKAEKEPTPQVATILLEKDAEVIARKFDPETNYLKDKKRILHQRIFYDKPTGEFTAIGPGEVFFYTTSSKDDEAQGPLANDRRVVKPAAARADGLKAKKPTKQPQLKLTHVRFQKRMDGRFAPPKDAKPGDYSSVFFSGSVEAMTAEVKNEDVILDADHPPDDYYRLVSKYMTVNVEPPPSKDPKEKDRVLLDAWPNAHAETRQKAIDGDQITYDSMSELTYIYGDKSGVSITNQDGIGQPFSKGRSRAVRYNHKTGESQIIDPKTFDVVDPRGGKQSTVVPIDPGKMESRNVGALKAPGRPTKPRDINDPATKAKQLKLPPRSSIERRGFYGH